MSGTKLVETLAESLLNEFSKSKDLSLMNDTKFSEITDLLWEILDRQDKAEDREKKKGTDGIDKELERKLQLIENQIKKTNENLETAEHYNQLRYSQLDVNQKYIAGLIKGEDGGETEEKDKRGKLKLKQKNKTKKQAEYEEDNERRERKRNSKERTENERKIRRGLDSLKKDFKKGEKRNERRSKETLRGLKKIDRKVGSIIYKVFNKLKAFLLVGLAVLFAKPIWNALKESIKPIWKKLKPKVEKWFNDLKKELSIGVESAKNALKEWFKATFPKLNEWITTEYPKVKNWFEKNWESVKDWFANTLPEVMNTINGIWDSGVSRMIRRWTSGDEKKELKDLEFKHLHKKGYYDYNNWNPDEHTEEENIEFYEFLKRYAELKKKFEGDLAANQAVSWEKGKFFSTVKVGSGATEQYREKNKEYYGSLASKATQGLDLIHRSQDVSKKIEDEKRTQAQAQYQQQQDELAAAYASRSAESLGASAPQQGGGMGGNVFVTQTTNNNTTMVVEQTVEESHAQ